MNPPGAHRATVTAPRHAVAESGDAGASIADDYGIAVSGVRGLARSGQYGFSKVGAFGVATSGPGGCAMAGHDGILILSCWVRGACVTHTARVGVDGIEPDTLYRASARGVVRAPGGPTYDRWCALQDVRPLTE